MKLDMKTIAALSAMPDERLWHTLRLFASGAGIELPERKRRRIDYDALRHTLANIRESDVLRANEIIDGYQSYRKGGVRR